MATGPKRSFVRAADVLLSRGLLTAEQMNIAVSQQRRMTAQGERMALDDIFVLNGFITRSELAAAALEVEGAQLAGGVSTSDNDDSEANRLIRAALPYNLCRRLGVRPIKKVGKRLMIATTRPLSKVELDELLAAAVGAGLSVDEIFVAPRDKKETLALFRAESQVDPETLARKIDRLNNSPDEGALVQEIINDIMIDAILNRASDIHLDNVEDAINSWVAFRVDGDLRYRYLFSPDAAKRIATRLKNDAGMDFSDVRRPQDGRFPFNFDNRKIDVRVAAIPIDGGETLTMRLLDPGSLYSLNELFVDSPHLLRRLQQVTRIRNKSGGIVIVSGPTGSGKTTTLYAIIRQIDRHRLNVMSVEDPIEYRIPLVRQTQINPDIGATFAQLLRAQLRHDPDILVIGEMRDAITAETAIRSTESGHFVLTTLHSADALQTIERMTGLFQPEYRASGIFVLAHYLQGIVNQRLSKRVCQACSVERSATEWGEMADIDPSRLGLEPHSKIRIANPDGCSACGYTGYLGRVMIPETIFFPADPDIRHTIANLLQSNRTSEILQQPGVILESRKQSVAALLQRGVIDPETALAAVEAFL